MRNSKTDRYSVLSDVSLKPESLDNATLKKAGWAAWLKLQVDVQKRFFVVSL